MMNGTDQGDVREMLTAEQLLLMIPLSRSALQRLEAAKLFPQGQQVSARKRLWFRDEVVTWQRDIADPESTLSKAVRMKLKPRKGDTDET